MTFINWVFALLKYLLKTRSLVSLADTTANVRHEALLTYQILTICVPPNILIYRLVGIVLYRHKILGYRRVIVHHIPSIILPIFTKAIVM